MKRERLILSTMRLATLCLLASGLLPSLSRAQVPTFVISPEESTLTFYVKASVALTGRFDQWDATLTYPSTDATAGVLAIKIQAASVNTGSGMKDGKLKDKDFFDVKEYPEITFVSKKVVQTGPNTLEVQGDFTIRGVSKPQTLSLTISGKGTGSGNIKGTMFFDRDDYGMTHNIPFMKVADRIEVTADLKGKRVSGPPLVFKE
jgi:polyisoprenoid-binding protein YceI